MSNDEISTLIAEKPALENSSLLYVRAQKQYNAQRTIEKDEDGNLSCHITLGFRSNPEILKKLIMFVQDKDKMTEAYVLSREDRASIPWLSFRYYKQADVDGKDEHDTRERAFCNQVLKENSGKSVLLSALHLQDSPPEAEYYYEDPGRPYFRPICDVEKDSEKDCITISFHSSDLHTMQLRLQEAGLFDKASGKLIGQCRKEIEKLWEREAKRQQAESEKNRQEEEVRKNTPIPEAIKLDGAFCLADVGLRDTLKNALSKKDGVYLLGDQYHALVREIYAAVSNNKTLGEVEGQDWSCIIAMLGDLNPAPKTRNRNGDPLWVERMNPDELKAKLAQALLVYFAALKDHFGDAINVDSRIHELQQFQPKSERPAVTSLRGRK